MATKSTKQILYELMATQSDTGTKMTHNIAEKIFTFIKEDEYFQTHPDLCGTFTSEGMGRGPVVWALKKGKSQKTLILSGHYDAVEIDSYGHLKPYALQPDKLRVQMKELGTAHFAGDPDLASDLDDQNWVFGRGGADMKGGLASNLQTLFDHKDGDCSILFTAVDDEENLSEGARLAVDLYAQLQRAHGLDYELCIISESSGRDPGSQGAFELIGGSAGKILPVVVAKGRLAHSSYMMNGLNSALLVAEVIRRVEMAPDLVSSDLGLSLQPPTTQIVRDQKEGYDVSMPQYTAAGFNMTFLMSLDPLVLVERLREICSEAFTEAVDKYNRIYDQLSGKGMLPDTAKVAYRPLVMTLEELRSRLRRQDRDFDAFERDLEDRVRQRISGGRTLQEAAIYYICETIERSGISEPMMVIGISPPFYPSVNNRYLEKDIGPLLEALDVSLRSKYGFETVDVPYAHAMTDMSYMSCVNPQGAEKVMANMAIPDSLYSIDFEALAELNVPTLHIGPAGKAIHQVGERVYLPDVVENIPKIFKEIAALI